MHSHLTDKLNTRDPVRAELVGAAKPDVQLSAAAVRPVRWSWSDESGCSTKSLQPIQGGTLLREYTKPLCWTEWPHKTRCGTKQTTASAFWWHADGKCASACAVLARPALECRQLLNLRLQQRVLCHALDMPQHADFEFHFYLIVFP